MKKIILATDGWYPQVSGLVRCVDEVKKNLEKDGFEVTLIQPGLFHIIPIFFQFLNLFLYFVFHSVAQITFSSVVSK